MSPQHGRRARAGTCRGATAAGAASTHHRLRMDDARNRMFPARVDVMPLREETTMRWKISHHDHDPRQIDLLAIIVIVVAIAAAWFFFIHRSDRTSTAAFIVP